jgi:hypothetical protein
MLQRLIIAPALLPPWLPQLPMAAAPAMTRRVSDVQNPRS